MKKEKERWVRLNRIDCLCLGFWGLVFEWGYGIWRVEWHGLLGETEEAAAAAISSCRVVAEPEEARKEAKPKRDYY